MFIRLLALISIFGSTAVLAQTAAEQGPTAFERLVLPVGVLLIIYVFMIRPQQRRIKDHQALIAGLKPGDEVVTSGGIIGRVKSVTEGFVNVEIAGDTVIKVLKSAIEGQSPKSQAAPKSN